MQESEKSSTALKRLQFDFAPEAVERLDFLKKQANAQTRAEVIRKALNFYDWLLTDVGIEDTLVVLDSSKNKKDEIRARLFR